MLQPIKWSFHDDQKLAEMYAAGASRRDMAAHFGCGPESVRTRINKLKLNKPVPATAKAPEPNLTPRWSPPREIPAPPVVSRSRTCLWPLWANTERPGVQPRFCGAPSEVNSYCCEHAETAYHKPEDKPEGRRVRW